MNKAISRRLSKVKELKETIRPEIEKLSKEIRDLQKKCGHKNFTTKKGANTGNWCEEDNIYWVDVRCSDCGWSDVFYYHKDRDNYLKYS